MDMMHTLAELTAAYGPSGMEKGVAGVIEKIAASYCDEVTYDVMGNLFCHRKGSGPRVMFAAHMDSIGLVATHIDRQGICPCWGHRGRFPAESAPCAGAFSKRGSWCGVRGRGF